MGCLFIQLFFYLAPIYASHVFTTPCFPQEPNYKQRSKYVVAQKVSCVKFSVVKTKLVKPGKLRSSMGTRFI